MKRRTQCNTLDAAGFTYNPYTTLDTFGAPSGLMLTALEQHELPLGADTSAMPALGDPRLRNGAPHTGSDASPPYNRRAKDKMEQMAMANATLLAFIGIVALALWLKLPALA